jgi:hypothetical protein
MKRDGSLGGILGNFIILEPLTITLSSEAKTTLLWMMNGKKRIRAVYFYIRVKKTQDQQLVTSRQMLWVWRVSTKLVITNIFLKKFIN